MHVGSRIYIPSCSTNFSTAGTREEESFFCVLLELGSHCLHYWCLFVSPDNTASELVYDDGALWCTSFCTQGLCTLDFIWICE